MILARVLCHFILKTHDILFLLLNNNTNKIANSPFFTFFILLFRAKETKKDIFAFFESKDIPLFFKFIIQYGSVSDVGISALDPHGLPTVALKLHSALFHDTEAPLVASHKFRLNAVELQSFKSEFYDGSHGLCGNSLAPECRI